MTVNQGAAEEIEVADIDAGIFPRGRGIEVVGHSSLAWNNEGSARRRECVFASNARLLHAIADQPDIVHVRCRKMPMLPDGDEAQDEAGGAAHQRRGACAEPHRRATTRTAEPMIAASRESRRVTRQALPRAGCLETCIRRRRLCAHHHRGDGGQLIFQRLLGSGHGEQGEAQGVDDGEESLWQFLHGVEGEEREQCADESGGDERPAAQGFRRRSPSNISRAMPPPIAVTRDTTMTRERRDL